MGTAGDTRGAGQQLGQGSRQHPAEGKSKFKTDQRFSKGPALPWSLRKLLQQIFRVTALPCALAELQTDICKLFLLHSPATSIILSPAHLFVLLSSLLLTVARGTAN